MRDEFRSWPLPIKVVLCASLGCYAAAAVLYILAAFGVWT